MARVGLRQLRKPNTGGASLKTEDKAGINRGQIEDKPKTNRGQTGDKEETNQESLKKNEDIVSQTEDQTGDKTKDKPETNRRQRADKPETYPPVSLLVGLQKQTMFYCYDSTKKTRTKSTEPLVLSEVAKSLDSSPSSVKKTLQRLEYKFYLLRSNFKNGRSGWSTYIIPDKVYQDLLQLETEDKLRTNWRQTEDKVGTKLETKPRTSSPSSRVSSFTEPGFGSESENTATKDRDPEPEKKEMPAEWQEIDRSSLLKIQFGATQLKQIFDTGKLTAEEVQNSIYEMEHDLKVGGHGMKNPLAVFMKELRVNGLPYTASQPGYESPEMKHARARLEERKRRQAVLNEIKAQEEEISNQCKKREEQGLFQEWLSQLNEAQIKAYTMGFNPNLPSGQATLREAFRKEQEQITTVFDEQF